MRRSNYIKCATKLTRRQGEARHKNKDGDNNGAT